MIPGTRVCLALLSCFLAIGIINSSVANSPSQRTFVTSTLLAASDFSYVVIIVMENKNYADIIGNPSAPYENLLARDYAYSSNYHMVSNYGSLPEYIALASGNSYDTVWSACNNRPTTCTGWPASGVTDPTIVTRLESAGLSWKAYMENMPSNCYESYSGLYSPIHNPFIYFSPFQDPASSECAKVVPAGTNDATLLSDLSSTSTASNFIWLTPNSCNQMHDSGCTVSTGDAYLSVLVPQILNSNIFKTQRAALFITWDETSGSGSTTPVPAIWAGSAVKNNYTTGTTSYTHYSFLKTVESVYGLSSLTSNDASTISMSEFFTAPGPTSLQTSFAYNPKIPQVGQTISFTSTAIGGTIPYTYAWTFGDQSTAIGNSPTHSYNVAGTYSVTVSVTNSKGMTASSSQQVIVTPPPPPLTTSFIFAPSSPNTGDTITFTSSASGGMSPYSFTWDFGDGVSSTGSTTTHAFSTAGPYRVNLIAFDSASHSTSSVQTVTVSTLPPLPLMTNFTYSSNPSAQDRLLTFKAAANGGTGPYSYSWDFGDGNSAKGAIVYHAYARNGNYPVALTTIDNVGRTVTKSQVITINPASAPPAQPPAPPPPINQPSNGGGCFLCNLSQLTPTFSLLTIGLSSGALIASGVFLAKYRGRNNQLAAQVRSKALLPRITAQVGSPKVRPLRKKR